MPTLREPLACALAIEDESACSESSEGRGDLDILRGEAMVVDGDEESNGDLVESADRPRWGQLEGMARLEHRFKGRVVIHVVRLQPVRQSRQRRKRRPLASAYAYGGDQMLSILCRTEPRSRIVQAMHACMSRWGRVIAVWSVGPSPKNDDFSGRMP